MKQRTHTWLAIRAIALLEDSKAAPGLVGLLKPHVNSVAIGSWIPDLADAKRGSGDIDNHVFKMKPYDGPNKERFIKNKQKTLRELGPARLMSRFITDWGAGLGSEWWNSAYKATPTPGEHLANRAMALTTTLIDQLTLGDSKVSSLIPGGAGSFARSLDPNARTRVEEVATHFFMLSHFIADSCQPLHCDARIMAGFSNGVHKELEQHWDKRVGTYFDKNRLLKTTDTAQTILKKARAVDQELGIQFEDDVPKIIAGDTWLEILSVCRGSFAISNILVSPDIIPYGSKKRTTFKTVFEAPSVDVQLLENLDKAVLHDAVLNIAMIWKEVWAKFH